MKERITNTIKTLYNMNYIVMGHEHPISQYALTCNIIKAFESVTPHPISLSYIFENTNDEKNIMITITDDGYFTMREPTEAELNDYWKEWEE